MNVDAPASQSASAALLDTLQTSIQLKAGEFLKELENSQYLLRMTNLGDNLKPALIKFMAGIPAIVTAGTSLIKEAKAAIKIAEEKLEEYEKKEGGLVGRESALERKEREMEKRERLLESKERELGTKIDMWKKKLEKEGMPEELEVLKEMGKEDEQKEGYALASLPNEIGDTLGSELLEMVLKAVKSKEAEIVYIPNKCTTGNPFVEVVMALDNKKPKWRDGGGCGQCKGAAKGCHSNHSLCGRCDGAEKICFWPLARDVLLLWNGSSGLPLQQTTTTATATATTTTTTAPSPSQPVVSSSTATSSSIN